MANVASSNTGAKNLGGSGVLYTDRRDFYIKPNVVKELWTDVTPFTTVIANQNTISGMSDPTFKMFEHRNPWVNQTLTLGTDSANIAPGADSALLKVKSSSNVGGSGSHWVGLEVDIATSAGALLGQGVIKSWDNDFDDSGSGTEPGIVITVLNSYDAGGIDFADDCVATVIGNAHGEGTNSPEAWSDDLSVVYNSCQIFKTPLEITGTLLEASLRGESKELARLRTMKSQEHKIQKERAFLFGANPKGISGGFSDIEAVADAGGKAVRSTMGIVSALKKYGNSSGDAQNVFASSDIDTYPEFVDAMEKIFQYVPTAGIKRAFVGPGALGYFSKQGGGTNDQGWAKGSSWTVNLGDMKRDALGFNYRMLETPHGMLQLIPTPAFRYNYSKHMLIVDDDNLFHAQYRAPQFQASIQANDYDGVKDQYMSDEGIGISLLESHALMVTP